MHDGDLKNFRLAFMQEVLPVGAAIVERVRKGGLPKFIEFFSSAKDPLSDLRKEGESSASSLREQLDDINPGLGNPVMEVQVKVDNNDDTLLDKTLLRIKDRLDLLELYLKDNQD